MSVGILNIRSQGSYTNELEFEWDTQLEAQIYVKVMRESNRNLDIPPPGHTPGNLDFDILVRSNSLHIFVIPVQIHHVL
jgi:hypothetical protein